MRRTTSSSGSIDSNSECRHSVEPSAGIARLRPRRACSSLGIKPRRLDGRDLLLFRSQRLQADQLCSSSGRPLLSPDLASGLILRSSHLSRGVLLCATNWTSDLTEGQPERQGQIKALPGKSIREGDELVSKAGENGSTREAVLAALMNSNGVVDGYEIAKAARVTPLQASRALEKLSAEGLALKRGMVDGLSDPSATFERIPSG